MKAALHTPSKDKQEVAGNQMNAPDRRRIFRFPAS
jgi:hypothetical protein